ncbi:MAG: hypothetical protein O7B26_01330, partial [Planctomycetota bacterium]|nr:hypothetical protein [Planctomycetota bacterium]
MRTKTGAALLLLACVAASGLDCLNGTGPVGDPIDLRVTLRIVNASGVEVAVESTFFNDVFQVRSTMRNLAADGPTAQMTIVGTVATRIILTARARSNNQILVQAELLNGRDFSFGESFEFVIGGVPAPTPPCPLIADAGLDQSVVSGALVTLADASPPRDSSCVPIVFDWRQTGGPLPIALANANTASPSFTAPGVGAVTVFSFELTIGEGTDTTASDIVQVTVSPDCDGNGIADADDIAGGAADCQPDGVPDVCQPQPDCNGNGVPDECDIADAAEADCNGNLVPDSCDIAGDPSLDCNGNGRIDACELADGSALDCNGNQVIDSCDIAGCIEDPNCADCNGNGVPDGCEIAAAPEIDCNENFRIDACELDEASAPDCNGNQVIDSCDIAGCIEDPNCADC